jgi:hypothetical protein
LRRLLLSQFAEDDVSRLERQTLYIKRENLWLAVVNRARTTSKTPKGPLLMHFLSTCTVIHFIVLITVAVLLAKGPYLYTNLSNTLHAI